MQEKTRIPASKVTKLSDNTIPSKPCTTAPTSAEPPAPPTVDSDGAVTQLAFADVVGRRRRAGGRLRLAAGLALGGPAAGPPAGAVQRLGRARPTARLALARAGSRRATRRPEVTEAAVSARARSAITSEGGHCGAC